MILRYADDRLVIEFGVSGKFGIGVLVTKLAKGANRAVAKLSLELCNRATLFLLLLMFSFLLEYFLKLIITYEASWRVSILTNRVSISINRVSSRASS
jgi:hypothetical protein